MTWLVSFCGVGLVDVVEAEEDENFDWNEGSCGKKERVPEYFRRSV